MPSLPTDDDKRIADNLASIVHRRGVTRWWLARETGMSVHELGRRIRGEVGMKGDEIIRVAHALGIPESALLTGATGRSSGKSRKPPVSPAFDGDLDTARTDDAGSRGRMDGPAARAHGDQS